MYLGSGPLSYLTIPYLTSPHLASPRLTVPYLTLTLTRYLNLAVRQGELVGTLDHPIFVNGSWVEAADAHERGLLAGESVDR